MPITIFDIDVCPRSSDDNRVVLVRQLKAMILDECKKSKLPASSFYRIIQVIEDAEGLPQNERITPKRAGQG